MSFASQGGVRGLGGWGAFEDSLGNGFAQEACLKYPRLAPLRFFVNSIGDIRITSRSSWGKLWVLKGDTRSLDCGSYPFGSIKCKAFRRFRACRELLGLSGFRFRVCRKF